MPSNTKEVQTVYIIRDCSNYDIQTDDIIETAPDRFRSIKYRHTFYRTGEFFSTRDEAHAHCEGQHKK